MASSSSLSSFACASARNELTISKNCSNLTTIGNSAFYFAYALKSIYLPQSVIEIGEMAFAGCLSLNTITIPNGVETLNESVFNGSGISKIDLPNSLKTIY